jgi:hypothetical protein
LKLKEEEVGIKIDTYLCTYYSVKTVARCYQEFKHFKYIILITKKKKKKKKKYATHKVTESNRGTRGY